MINDIAIYESAEGGELQLKNGDISTVSGFTNMAFLSWFGGSIDESTTEFLTNQESRSDWWGNSLFDKEENQFNSTLEKLLKTTEINAASVSVIENAAKKDLEFLKKYGNVEVNVYLVKTTEIEIEAIFTEPNKKSLKSSFLWDATKNTVINDYTIS